MAQISNSSTSLFWRAFPVVVLIFSLTVGSAVAAELSFLQKRMVTGVFAHPSTVEPHWTVQLETLKSDRNISVQLNQCTLRLLEASQPNRTLILSEASVPKAHEAWVAEQIGVPGGPLPRFPYTDPNRGSLSWVNPQAFITFTNNGMQFTRFENSSVLKTEFYPKLSSSPVEYSSLLWEGRLLTEKNAHFYERVTVELHFTYPGRDHIRAYLNFKKDKEDFGTFVADGTTTTRPAYIHYASELGGPEDIESKEVAFVFSGIEKHPLLDVKNGPYFFTLRGVEIAANGTSAQLLGELHSSNITIQVKRTELPVLKMSKVQAATKVGYWD